MNNDPLSFNVFILATRQSNVQKTISLVLIGISEKFFQILKAKFLIFNGVPMEIYYRAAIAARGSEGVNTQGALA